MVFSVAGGGGGASSPAPAGASAAPWGAAAEFALRSGSGRPQPAAKTAARTGKNATSRMHSPFPGVPWRQNIALPQKRNTCPAQSLCTRSEGLCGVSVMKKLLYSMAAVGALAAAAPAAAQSGYYNSDVRAGGAVGISN